MWDVSFNTFFVQMSLVFKLLRPNNKHCPCLLKNLPTCLKDNIRRSSVLYILCMHKLSVDVGAGGHSDVNYKQPACNQCTRDPWWPRNESCFHLITNMLLFARFSVSLPVSLFWANAKKPIGVCFLAQNLSLLAKPANERCWLTVNMPQCVSKGWSSGWCAQGFRYTKVER